MAAHRGGAALWPENSLLAFRNAIALGVALVELDVHLTRDGDVVVIHDRTLERTTDGAGPVADRTIAELARLRLRDRGGSVTDERVPALDEVLSLIAASEVSLLLEVKGPGPSVFYERADGRVQPAPGPRYEGLEAAVLARLRARGLEARTTVMAFNPAVVTEWRRLAPAAAVTLLLGAEHLALSQLTMSEMLGFAESLGVTDLGLDRALVTADVVTDAHARGLTLGAWTVNDADEMRRCAAAGVDTVTSDRPDLALEVLGGADAARCRSDGACSGTGEGGLAPPDASRP